MNDTPEMPPWLTVGAAVMECGSRTSAYGLKRTTIERFTKTLIVLANGSRYDITPRPEDGRVWFHQRGDRFGLGYRLVAPDDPVVAVARAAITVSKARRQVHNAYDVFRSDQASPALVRALADAASAYANLLEPLKD